ncbi:AP-5 complex subunit mu [Bienertia sinuspersici]
MVAHVIGDIIMGDIVEPEIAVSASPSVGGLLDSLTGSIGISGISARGKPAPASVAASPASPASLVGSVMSDAQKAGSKPVDKDALQSFVSSSMPFGTPLDLSYSNLSAIRQNGFSSSDVPPADIKMPAWKPYLYRGKQRMLFTIYETINAAMYDRDEIPDSISISGQVNCRAELEGLSDVSFPLTGLNNSRIEVSSFHPCVQVPEQDHSIEWKVLTSGRGVSGKSVEATFPGTVKFAHLQTQKSLGSVRGTTYDEDSDTEMEKPNNGVNIEELLEEKMRKDLPPIDLEEPFCWQAYDYAKVTAGDYILWNTLGKCPSAAMPVA